MIRFRAAVLGALCLLTCGCAYMRIEVKVLDSTKLDRLEVLQRAAPEMQIRAQRLVSGPEVDKIQEEIRLDRESAVGQAILEGLASETDREALQRPALAMTSGPVGSAREHYAKALAKFAEFNAIAPSEYAERRAQALSSLDTAAAECQLGDQALMNLAPIVDDLYADLARLPTKDGGKHDYSRRRAALRAAIVRQASAAQTHSGALLSAAELAMVVGAPDVAWSGLYNHVYGGGQFGNVDVAVIQENVATGPETSGSATVSPLQGGVPAFYLKGVRLDSGSVTRATFQGVKDLLRVARAVAGLPASGSSSTAQDGPAARRSRDEADAEAIRQSSVAWLDDVFLLSGTLVDPKADEASRDQVIASLKSALATFQANIKPSN